MELFLATTNAGKLRDFAQALTPGVTLAVLPGLAGLPVPAETAETFIGNATLKALAYSLAAPGAWVLADDSGLEVDALGGAPGVRSARYAEDSGFAGTGSTDERNNAVLVAALASAHAEHGSPGRYRCALVLACDGRVLAMAEGAVEGEVLTAPRGAGGFGYDPYFLLPEPGVTMAEADGRTRQRYSHRARALADLLTRLHDIAQESR